MQETARQRTTRPAATAEYDDVRSSIKNGDVLLYRGTSLYSRLIMFVTRAWYSHAGLAVWWNERLMVMEAVGRGVIISPLSSSVDKYDGRVDLFTAREEIATVERLTLVMFAQEELGKEYATWKAVLLGIRLFFQWNIGKRDALRRASKLFCSYYVAQAYNAIGRDLKRNFDDRFMTPGDIANSPVLRPVATLRSPTD